MADSSHRWFLALGGAALLMSGSLGSLVLLRKRRDPPAPTPPAASRTAEPELAGGACGPQRSDYHPLPDAEASPVILWAAGAARLFVDEQPAYSPPEKPKRFAPGEHAVRIEAPGEEPIRTRIRVDPFTPVLLHAQADPQFGLSLVRFGAGCLPCEPPAGPVDLSPRKPTPGSAVLLASAGHLRHDRWPQAAEGIRRASVADRKRSIFYRLAAITAEDGAQHDLARALLQRVPPAQSNDLATILPVFDKLVAAESRRRKEVTLARWNKITEWFATISAKYQGDAASLVSAATKRFSQLSLVFDTAVREGTIEQQAEVVRAGEQTLTSLIKELRAQKPEDCRFQQELSAVGAQK